MQVALIWDGVETIAVTTHPRNVQSDLSGQEEITKAAARDCDLVWRGQMADGKKGLFSSQITGWRFRELLLNAHFVLTVKISQKGSSDE